MIQAVAQTFLYVSLWGRLTTEKAAGTLRRKVTGQGWRG